MPHAVLLLAALSVGPMTAPPVHPPHRCATPEIVLEAVGQALAARDTWAVWVMYGDPTDASRLVIGPLPHGSMIAIAFAGGCMTGSAQVRVR